jgi:hypothetical protein
VNSIQVRSTPCRYSCARPVGRIEPGARFLLWVAFAVLAFPGWAAAQATPRVASNALESAPASSLHGLFFPPIVAAGPVPTPDDTIAVTGTQPYLGQTASGRGYVLLAPGHSALTNPILVVEGFDLDNSMDWDELYTLLNQEALVESLGARGYDAVVLDFTDATDYIQRNAFVFTALLGEVEAAIDPGQTISVIGPSMGGLVARYGLAWLEANAIPHRVRTFISFDAPQRGANIPLGLQHWVDFFAGQSADAATFRTILNSPAARQMLVYQFGSTAGQTAAADPLRAALVADLAAVGDYPAQPRRVAFANGAGDGTGQGYAPGAQLISYGYNAFPILINGNVWAVPNGGPTQIFQGRIRVFLISDMQKNVTVTGTRPYDSAPGGWRASMAQLDTTTAPYGDIVALHDAHCFIPTVSALDVDDQDLYRNLSAVPDVAAESPFDAVYWQPTNEEHVHISPLTAQHVLDELVMPVVGVAPGDPALAFTLDPVRPNPARGGSVVSVRFTLPRAATATLGVFDPKGRLVRTLATGVQPAGAHTVRWDLRDDGGQSVRTGLYFVRVAALGIVRGQRVVALQ